MYNHPEVDRTWGIQGNIMVLSKWMAVCIYIYRERCIQIQMHI